MKTRYAEKRVRPQLEDIEPRILYSADAGALLTPDALAPSAEVRVLDLSTPATSPAAAETSAAQKATQEIVFVNTDVRDYQSLVNDITKQADNNRNIQVILLDSQKDGLQQISEVLQTRHDLDAIHIISHGNDGDIELGSTHLDSETLQANSQAIKDWGNAFGENGDILIYGCNLAETNQGKSLVNQLSDLTLADVAASDDLTGNASRGGDWYLEYRTGAIEASVAVSSAEQAVWDDVLAANTAPVLTLPSGAASYTEDAAAVVLDGGATVFDAELTATNFSGATLTLVRNGGANAQDVFSATGTLSALTQGSTFSVGGTTIGTVTTNSGGTLTLTFNASATNALVDSAMQQIAYLNSSQSPPASVQINWTFDDGNSGAQGTGGALNSMASVTVNITAVNDAPTITSGATVTLTTTNEDTTSSSTTVSSILTSASRADADAVALSGIAITGLTGNGTWQYSTDGVTWNSFGAVSASSALLLDSASQIRYIPDGQNGETATFSFRAWDQTTGTASTNGGAVYADASVNGTTTAYSTGSATASLTVTAVNDAPVNTVPASYTTNEDTSFQLTGLSVADTDAASGSITVTLSVTHGTLTATNGGGVTVTGSATSSIVLTGTVANINAYLAGGSAPTYLSTLNYNGSDTLTMLTNDGGSTGSGGAKTDSDTVAITINAVNDAPTITNGATVTLTTTNEDTTSSSTTVSSILTSASRADADAGALSGIAITGLTGNGTWQYSTDGVTWNSFGAVSASSALLLDSASQIRYIPDGQNGETATFSFRAWDQTTGTASTNGGAVYADASVNGTTTAYSTGSATASLTVTAVNDAPVNTVPASYTTNEDTSIQLTGLSVADTDAASGSITVTLSVTHGTLTASSGGGVTVTGSASSSIVLTGTVANINAYLAGGSAPTYLSTLNYNGSDTLTMLTNDGGNTGSGGAKTDSDTVAITVNAVNDAPTITNGATVTLTTALSNTATAGNTVTSILATAGVNYTDVDTGAVKGIAITSVTGSGTWQYSTDGVTWTAFGAVSASNTLLLDATTQIRYNPASQSETATFGFRGWDTTTGSASVNGSPSYANPGAGGTTTAYSVNSATTSIRVNSAPTITNGATVSLPTITEDNITATGTTVLSILTSASHADVDTNAVKGIAITGKTGNGTWQYSADGGTSWASFGTVTGTSSLLLDSSTLVRYVPDQQNGETATFSFRAWDITTGTASTNATPQTANTSSNGTSTAYSTEIASTSIVVTSLNDAPTITNGTTVTLGNVLSATPSAGVTVTTILTGAGYLDVDTGAVKGLAITASTGSGVWEYSTNGVAWNTFGAISTSNALVLGAGSQVRYTPTTVTENATITFKAWDQTTDNASTNGTAKYGDASVNGTTTAYSTSTATGVFQVNDAPTITNGSTVTLSTITEDNITATGTSVATILGTAGVNYADPNPGAVQGLAITATAGNGTWQYSTNNGTSWVSVGAVSNTNALLLDNAATTLVRYVPNQQNGETATFSFRAWDRTTGTASTNASPQHADTSSNGGATSYSSGVATTSIVVTSLNDAPTITNGATVTLTTAVSNTATAGNTVSSILGAVGVNYADVDTGFVQGIAITSVTGSGTWQYSTDGVTWTAFGAVSATNTLLLDATTQIRYNPASQSETATFGFRGWDTTTGSASVNGSPSYANPGAGGTTSAYSVNSATTSIRVNSAPTITNGATVSLPTITEDNITATGTTVLSILTSASHADIDTNAVKGIAITGKTGNGTWQYSTNGGASWASFGTVSGTSSLLLDSSTLVRYVPDQQNGETATFSFRAWDITTGTASTNATPQTANTSSNGTSTAYSTEIASTSIVVSSVNDAPTITNGATVTLTTTNEDTTSSTTTISSILSSASRADVDTGALSGIAITSKTGNGTWEYSTDGVSWTAFGSVSATNALLLTSTSHVRYVPDGISGETATFGFRAWDQSTDAASANGSPSYADASVNGTTTAYSTSSATASMTVTSVNDAPVNTVPGAKTTLEDTTIAITGLSIADVDAASGSMTVTLNVLHGTLTVSGGTAGISGSGTSSVTLTGTVAQINATLAATVNYVPTADYNGSDTLTMATSDNGNTGSGGTKTDSDTVAITVTSVNDAPAGANKTITFNEDNNYTLTAADFGFTDTHDSPANNFVSVKITSIPGAGTLKLNGVAVAVNDVITVADINSGLLVFTPVADANGTGYANFSFQVQDDGGTTNGGADIDPTANTITFDVTAVNDAPVNTVPASYSTDEDIAIKLSGLSVADVDAAAGTVTVTLSVSHGTIAATSAGGVTVGGSGTASLTLSGTLTNLNTYLSTVANQPTYTPTLNYNGTDTLTMLTSDGGNTGSGGTKTDSDMVTITITSVNDAPTGTNKTITTNEDTAYTLTVADFGYGDSNDSPANNFVSVKITSIPGAGTLKLNGVAVAVNDVITVADISSGLLVFTPVADAHGTGYANFSFQVQDDGGTTNGGADIDPTANTITFDVTSVNDAPSGTDKTITTNEDTAYTFVASDFGFGDSHDSPANTLAAVKITTIPGAGSLTLSGVAVTVGQVVSVANINSGLLVFTPAANANGAGYASFTFQVQDNGGTSNGGVDLDPAANTITLDVTSVNDAPTGTNKTITTNEDTAYTLTVADFGYGDSNDTPANNFVSVKITAIPGAGTLKLNGVTVAVNDVITVADISSGLLVFTPTANANGAGYASFSFKVQDDGGTTSGGVDTDPTANTITFDVTAVNDAPVNTVPGAQATHESTTLHLAGSLSIADVDVATGSMTVTLTVTHGTLVVSGGSAGIAGSGTSSVTLTGTLTQINATLAATVDYVPTALYNGAATLTMVTNDNGNTGTGGSLMDTDVVAITVQSVNNAPAGADKTITTLEDTAYTFTAADFGFSDVSDNPTPDSLLNVKITTLPGAGSLTLNGVAVTAGQFVSVANINAGKLVFTPALNANGTGYASFTFQVQDSGGTVNGGIDLDPVANTITMNVTAVNDAPVNTIPSSGLTTDANTSKAVTGLSIADVDAASGNITVTLSVSHGTITAAGGTSIITGSGTSNVVLTGTVSQINSTLASAINYVPSSNYVGGDTITMKTNDNGNVGLGGANVVTSTQSVTVNSVALNDPVTKDPVTKDPVTKDPVTKDTPKDTPKDPIKDISNNGGVRTSTITASNNGGTFQSANEAALLNGQIQSERGGQTANTATISTPSSQNNVKISTSNAQTFTVGDTVQVLDINAPKLQSNANIGALLKDIASGTKIHVEDVAKQTEAKHEDSNNLLTLSVQRKAQISSAAVSAGLVTWALSSTGLVSSVLATMPVWKDMDPVSILDTPNEDGPDLDQDDEDRNSEESAADVFSESDT